MKMRYSLSIILGLTGCEDTSFKPKPFTAGDGIKPGPGLFTGEKGEYEIFLKVPAIKKNSEK